MEDRDAEFKEIIESRRRAAMTSYQEAIDEFLQKLRAIDGKHGLHAMVEIKDVDVTALHDGFPRYVRTGKIASVKLEEI